MKISTPILELQPHFISTILFVWLAFLWHSYFLPLTYNFVGRKNAALIALHPHSENVFKESVAFHQHGPSFKTNFVLMGTFWHTISFLFGIAISLVVDSAKVDNNRKLLGSNFQVVVITGLFQTLLYTFLDMIYETKSESIHPYSSLFFDIDGGRSAFSWASSASFTIALILGIVVAQKGHLQRFHKVVLFGQDLKPSTVTALVFGAISTTLLSTYFNNGEPVISLATDLVNLGVVFPSVAVFAYSALPKSTRNSIKLYAMMTSLWMSYLVALFSTMVPFVLFGMTAHARKYQYTWGAVAYDWFNFFVFGPYICPIIIQGLIKMVCARKKIPWTWKQESFVIFICTVPLLYTCFIRYQGTYETHPGKFVYLTMSFLYLLYFTTYLSRPEVTQSRKNPVFREFIQPGIDILAEHFSFEIVNYNEEKSDAQGRLYGFHPHGVYPCSLVWQTLSTKLNRTMGKEEILPLTHSFTHLVPLMRELLQFSGFYEVTREVIRNLLDENKSILLVPGGEGEMFLHTRKNFDRKVIVLDSKHIGFVKLAFEKKAELVPCFNFGELDSMKNVHLPTIQHFCKKHIGVAVPFLPVGIGGYLPLPKQVKMTLVMGKAIDCSKYTATDDMDIASVVKDIHSLYLKRLREVFEAEKEKAGYKDWNLEFA